MSRILRYLPILAMIVTIIISCGSDKSSDYDESLTAKATEDSQNAKIEMQRIREDARKAREESRQLDSNFYNYDKFMSLIKDYSIDQLIGLRIPQKSVFSKASIKEINSTSHRVPVSKSKMKESFHALTDFKYFKYPRDEFTRHDLQEKHKSILSEQDYFVKSQKYYIEFPLNNRQLEEYNFDKKYYDIKSYWAFRGIEPGFVLDNIDLKRRDIFVMNPTLRPIVLSPDFGFGYTSKFRIYFTNAREAQRFKKDSKTIRANFLLKKNPVFDLKEKTYDAKLVSVEIHTKSCGHYLWRNGKWYLAFASQGLGKSLENDSRIYDLF